MTLARILPTSGDVSVAPAKSAVMWIGAGAFLALVGVGFGVGVFGPLVIIAMLGLTWMIVVVSRGGFPRLADQALVVAAFLAPMNAVRLSTSMNAADVFLVIAAGAILCRIAMEHRVSVSAGKQVFVGVALVICGGVLGTLIGATSSLVSLATILRFAIGTMGTVAIICAAQLSNRVLRRMLMAWLIGMSLSAAAGFVRKHGLEQRAVGLTTHENHLGVLCAMSIGLALALALEGWSRRVRWFGMATSALLTMAMLLSGSRAGFLGFVVASLIVMFRLGWKRHRPLLPLLLVLGLALVVGGAAQSAGTHTLERLAGQRTSSSAGSDTERKELLEKSLDRFVSSPLVGTGFENATEGHNVFVQIGAISGLVGVCGWILVIVVVVRRSWQSFGPEPPGWELRVMLAGVSAGFIGFLVAAVFQNTIWERYLWIWISLILVIGQRCIDGRTRTEDVIEAGSRPIDLRL